MDWKRMAQDGAERMRQRIVEEQAKVLKMAA